MVFRSPRARGSWNFLRFGRQIETILQKTAARFGVRVLRFQNVGNHLHLALKAKKKSEIQDFLRVFPQAVVFLVTKTRKGRPAGRFWEAIVFSRVVEWGRDWFSLQNYFEKNRFESLGMPRDVVDVWFYWH